MEDLIAYLNSINCEYKENESVRDYITFKVGGPCRLICFPENEESIIGIIDIIASVGLKYFILGKGSNLLCEDVGYDGVIISTQKLDYIRIDGNRIICGAGTSLMKVCRFALDNSISGLEFAFGIPGSVGGAVYMNAGAYGGEIKNVIESCRFIKDGSIESLTASEMDLSYRHSYFSDKNDVILSAVFNLEHGDKDEIKARMDDLIGRRKDKQPIEYPSAGSTFKRPEGYFAGALIQECGLKGKTVGGAQVSEKHAGFVINIGNATCNDIKELISLCQKTVYDKTGVYLETEVKFIN